MGKLSDAHYLVRVKSIRSLSEEEIETLANSQAEKEAFMKSTVAFVLTWLAGFLIIGFIPGHFI